MFVEFPDGRRVHVRRSFDKASGLTVLLLHGYADGGHVWDWTWERLLERFHLMAPDLRGHGESAWSAQGHYGLQDYVNDTLHLIEHFALERIALVGHSLGGQIALHVAALRPKLVKALALLDICLRPDIRGIAQARADLRESLRVYDSVTAYQQWLLDRRPLLSVEVASKLAQRALKRTERGYELKIDPVLSPQPSSGGVPTDILERTLLDGISCPTLLMRGIGSAYVSRAEAERTVGSIRNAQLVDIPGAGHALVTDNTTATNEVLANFLAKHC